MRGATCMSSLEVLVVLISIHAPHAGRDRRKCRSLPGSIGFQSTRPMRGATRGWTTVVFTVSFQSTRPMRGATVTLCPSSVVVTRFQSTRPMRGATLCGRRLVPLLPGISIHAPHAGRDSLWCPPASFADISIHAPHAGRDECKKNSFHGAVISIHAPHAGRDQP